MKRWISWLAPAGLIGAARASSTAGHHPRADVGDFDWESITPSPKLEYHPCYSGFQCARLTVPLDWLDEGNPHTVALAIIKLPAVVHDDDVAFGGTIFTNPGGPGGSGVRFVLSEGHVLQGTADSDSRKYEILSWDPRGVRLTTPGVDCYGDLVARDTDLIQSLAIGPPDASPDALRRRWARSHGFSQLCSQASAVNGSIIPFATTASVVRDMVEMLDKIQELRDEEAASRVGGIEAGGAQKPLAAREESRVPRIQYWGFSYGSLLGNTFASMFPGRVGRIIVDGIVDADDYVAGGWTTNLQDTEEVIEYFYKTCATAGPKCALSRPSDKKWRDVRQRVHDLVDRLDAVPVFNADGNVTNILTGYDVLNSFTRPMYKPYTDFTTLAKTINDAVEGNYTTLLETSAEDIPLLRQACAAPNATNPFLWSVGDGGQAVICGDAEDATNLTLAEYGAYVSLLRAQSPTFAGYWSQIRMACAGWHVRPKWRFTGPFATPEHDPALKEGKPAAPLLFVSSRLDPVTPLRNAYKMSERHPGSAVVIQESAGHCAVSSGSQCTTKVIREYLEHGVLPESGTVCQPDCDPWDGDTCSPTTMGVRVAALTLPHERLRL